MDATVDEENSNAAMKANQNGGRPPKRPEEPHAIAPHPRSASQLVDVTRSAPIARNPFPVTLFTYSLAAISI